MPLAEPTDQEATFAIQDAACSRLTCLVACVGVQVEALPFGGQHTPLYILASGRRANPMKVGPFFSAALQGDNTDCTFRHNLSKCTEVFNTQARGHSAHTLKHFRILPRWSVPPLQPPPVRPELLERHPTLGGSSSTCPPHSGPPVAHPVCPHFNLSPAGVSPHSNRREFGQRQESCSKALTSSSGTTVPQLSAHSLRNAVLDLSAANLAQ